MMRKMMSIVFLLLVLIISLGLSAYMQTSPEMKEGMEQSEPELEGEVAPELEGEVSPDLEGEVKPLQVDNAKESTLDVTPMEGSCTETMTNYN